MSTGKARATSPAKSSAKGRPTRVARKAEPRPLTDPKEMRALAHPLRIAILEALTREGPLTATEAASIIGESPANASFHLRTLAKYGFVEEAAGGTCRSRPWRRTHLGQSFSDLHEDIDVAIAADALSELSHQRFLKRFNDYQRHRHSVSDKWLGSSFIADTLLYLTSDELDALGDQMLELLEVYRERTLDKSKRPKDAGPVQIATFGFPLLPTVSGN